MAVKRVAGVLAAATLAVASVAAANSLSPDVQVQVRLVPSSGACGAIAGGPVVEVSCHPPGHPEAPIPNARPGGHLLPDAGAVPYRRVSAEGFGSLGVAREPLPVYSVGTKITSWRIVQLDNARYLELTIAW